MPKPILLFQAGLVRVRKSVNAYVSPEPSLRKTGVILVAGSETPGLMALIRLSFHWLIEPR